MSEVGLDPHRDLVNMLEEQMRLLDEPPYVLYEQVVIIGDRFQLTIGGGARIDSFVKLEIGQRLSVGRYVHIASFAHVGIGGGETLLGDFSAVASGAKIISGSNMTDAPSMSASAPDYEQRSERKRTVIGPYAAVLTNAVVLPGVTLGEGAVLAAGGVATRDIPAWEIWGGVPARKMGDRIIRRDMRNDR